MVSRRRFLAGTLALGAAAAARAEDDDAALWQQLRTGGLVVLIRHASTVPGLGDPEGFRLGDCSTQRNLSEAGREESRRIGARFKSEGVAVQEVLTSPWCRCRDTAMLAFGRAEDWEPLSSFFDMPHREAELTETVRKRILGYSIRKPAGNVAMVTHNVNIAALTRLSVAPAELVVVHGQGCCDVKPFGRIMAD